MFFLSILVSQGFNPFKVFQVYFYSVEHEILEINDRMKEDVKKRNREWESEKESRERQRQRNK